MSVVESINVLIRVEFLPLTIHKSYFISLIRFYRICLYHGVLIDLKRFLVSKFLKIPLLKIDKILELYEVIFSVTDLLNFKLCYCLSAVAIR